MNKKKQLKGLVALVSSETFGGFCRGRCPKTTLTIKNDGDVSRTRITYKDFTADVDSVSYLPLAKLSSFSMANVRKKVNALENGPLIDQNEDEPICADAPITRYSVVKTDLETFPIGKRQDCHTYQIRDYRARSLIELISSLSTLAY